jgi:protein involved in polysaccharide export with SLBB domain
VLGAVASPNIVPYRPDMSLAATIIALGGTVPYARQSKAVIVRGGLIHPQVAEVDFKAIITGKAKDVRLQPGDIVYVPFSPYRRLMQFADEMLDQFVRTVAVNEGRNLILGEASPAEPSFGIGGGFSTGP